MARQHYLDGTSGVPNRTRQQTSAKNVAGRYWNKLKFQNILKFCNLVVELNCGDFIKKEKKATKKQ